MFQKPDFSQDYLAVSQMVLNTALERVAAYRSWRLSDPGPGYSILERYTAMPVLTKKDIREHFPAGMAPADCDIGQGLASREIQFVKTSGSSDISVTNLWNQKWWNASEKASWALNSYASRVATGTHREAILANPLNVGVISDDVDLPIEKRRLDRFLYLNEKTDPTTWTPGLMGRMAQEMAEYQPVVLEANPSLLARLCRYLAAAGTKAFQPQLIILTYEFPTRIHLRQIQSVFSAPIASSYGTTETGYVLMQCEAGNLHQNTRFCRIDFQPLKPEHGGPWLGRMLVTTFNNPWYYIVHFDVGDLARIEPSGTCPCGRREGLVFAAVEGRTANITLTTGGRLVSQREADATVSAIPGIVEYRLDQLLPEAYEIHVSSDVIDRDALTLSIQTALTGLYDKAARVSVIYEDDIKPESSGKYRTSKALFPLDIEFYLAEKSVCRVS